MAPGASSEFAELPSRSVADLVRDGITHPIALAWFHLALLMPAVAVLGGWGLPIGRTVHLAADGRSTDTWSFQRTVGGVLASHHITLRDGDLVTPSPETRLWPGMQISVIRAVPVTLTVGGVTRGSSRVAATTVGEALKRMGVSVGAVDRIYPDPSSGLWPGMRITVERREMRTWTQREAVAFPSQTVNDPTLQRGLMLVRQSGRPGVRERTVWEVRANERLVAVSSSSWRVVQDPSPRIVAAGTRTMTADRGAFAGHEFMIMEATAYYPGPHNYGGGVGPRTAIGLLTQRGVVAVDPSIIRLGSHLYIEGYGYAVAGDTGGAIQGLRIDLCYNTYNEAIQFGRRPVKVYLLDRQ
jgi:3D (Asp-Asp-Asp) domain-containing protein